MKNFKQETFDNIQFYLQRQKELGMYIKVIFQTKGASLSIMVRNNVEITKKEQMRVFDRLARSRAFSSLEEAFSTVLDSRGGRLGIVILVLMMKKIGLTEDCFSIDSEDGETVATITIPFSEVHLELSRALNAQTKTGEALAEAREAVRLDPGNELDISVSAMRLKARVTWTVRLWRNGKRCA